jgi:hypothetical protein
MKNNSIRAVLLTIVICALPAMAQRRRPPLGLPDGKVMLGIQADPALGSSQEQAGQLGPG